MPAVIKLTLPDGTVEYVEDEYGCTPDLQHARLAYNNNSASALERRWRSFCDRGRNGRDPATLVEIVPINIVPA